MNFQQLRIIPEAVRRNFNLTEVANALYTSQSGISKHIKDLEEELGVELFVRKGKRLLGLTEPGKELLGIVERILRDTGNIKRVAEQFSLRDEGRLTITTTHTQARYSLPPVVAKFRQAFPKVHLSLYEGGPQELVSMMKNGEADIGPTGHPLERAGPLTVEMLAEYSIVTYHEGFTRRAGIDATFSSAGVSPDVVVSALDADIIKTYVELGVGIGILASMAFDAERDRGLRRLDASHLFPANTTCIAVRRGHYLRGYAYRFIELCSPALTEGAIRAAVTPARDDLGT